jgi:hypothetical protein
LTFLIKAFPTCKNNSLKMVSGNRNKKLKKHNVYLQYTFTGIDFMIWSFNAKMKLMIFTLINANSIILYWPFKGFTETNWYINQPIDFS